MTGVHDGARPQTLGKGAHKAIMLRTVCFTMKPNVIKLHTVTFALKKRTLSFTETFVNTEQFESCYNTETIKLEDGGGMFFLHLSTYLPRLHLLITKTILS
jgi:hypothetical protein